MGPLESEMPPGPKIDPCRPGMGPPNHVNSLFSWNFYSERLHYFIGSKMGPLGRRGGDISPLSSPLAALLLGLTWLTLFGSGSAQSIESPIIWEKQRSSSRSRPAEIPAGRPGVCRLSGGMVRFAGCACLLVRGVVWCRSDANSVLNNLRRVRSVRLPYWVGYQFVQFSSGHGCRVPPFSSFSSVHSAHFINSSGPASHFPTATNILRNCHLATPAAHQTMF